MKIEFQETTKDLAKRIDIHNRFGARDIDAWMLDLIDLQPGDRILDVGCGSGKQCFSYHDRLKGQAEIIGGDVSEDLLQQAREEDERRESHMRFVPLDFNKPFPFGGNVFSPYDHQHLLDHRAHHAGEPEVVRPVAFFQAVSGVHAQRPFRQYRPHQRRR